MRVIGLLTSPVNVGFNMAGLLCFMCGPWALHVAVRPSHWQWWYKEEWYDGPLPSWGFGPLFLLAGCDVSSWCYTCNTWGCVDRLRHGP